MVSKIKIIIVIVIAVAGLWRCAVAGQIPRSLEPVLDFWLTDDIRGDFNEDGIVNFIDFASAGSYGISEYGAGNYF